MRAFKAMLVIVFSNGSGGEAVLTGAKPKEMYK
jgi:hypothetical protein